MLQWPLRVVVWVDERLSLFVDKSVFPREKPTADLVEKFATSKGSYR